MTNTLVILWDQSPKVHYQKWGWHETCPLINVFGQKYRHKNMLSFQKYCLGFNISSLCDGLYWVGTWNFNKHWTEYSQTLTLGRKYVLSYKSVNWTWSVYTLTPLFLGRRSSSVSTPSLVRWYHGDYWSDPWDALLMEPLSMWLVCETLLALLPYSIYTLYFRHTL